MNAPMLQTSVHAFEQTYRGDHQHEHAALFDAQGQLIVSREGDKHSVDFTIPELNQACLGTLTHTHPLGKPPSVQDVATAIEYGLTLRAVGVSPDKESYEYTIEAPAPSQQMAKRVTADYEMLLPQAEAELAHSQLNDWKWEREARHLTLTRLAQRYGFSYQRIQRSKPVREMAASHEVQRLDTLAGLENALREEVLAPVHVQVSGVLLRYADPKGRIELAKLPDVRREVGRIVQRVILGKPLPDGSLSPYIMQRGKVMPHSVYFSVLFAAMRQAAFVSVQRHADIMRKHLPDDLVQALCYATVSPFTRLEEMDDTPDPLHDWLGEDGKRLLDRIWNVAGDLRRRLEQFINGLIASGRSASDIDIMLASYLDGVGGFEVKRLARTEVAAAANRADALAARLNPFVTSYTPYVSAAHKEIDECDEMVAGAPYPVSDTEHLPPFHAFCQCGIRWDEVEQPDEVVQSLRDRIADAVASARTAFTDVIGPLSQRFVGWLFGDRS